MKLKLMIVDLEVPPKVKRMALRLGVAGLVVGGGAGVAWAAMPHTFNAGETLKASELNENFAAMETRLAELQARLDAVEDPDSPCPAGYEQDASKTEFVLCKQGNDEVVKVGVGGGAFWIDRYEASVWEGTTQRFASGDDTSAGFPKNGQGTAPLTAKSVAGVVPSRNLTWFQAVEACAAGGKRLPDEQEWLRAARGTPDPGSSAGAGGLCVTSAGGPRQTGLGTACRSDWGAEDMIGNLWEWTSEWEASATPSDAPVSHAAPWPSEYGGDGTEGISSWALSIDAGRRLLGVPAAAIRGGSCAHGTRAGVFNLDLNHAPSSRYWDLGFRCVLPM